MLIQFAIKNLITKRRSSLVSLTGVIIGIGLVISVVLVLKSARASFARSLEGSGADMIVQLQGEPCVWSIVKLPQNLNPIPIKKIDEIASLDEVAAAEGSLITWAFSTPPPIRAAQEIESSSETQKLQGVMMALSKGELEGQPCDYAPEGSFCDLEIKPGNMDLRTADFRPIVVTGINPELKNIGPIKENDLNSLEGRFFTKEDNYVAILDKDFARTRDIKVGNEVDLGQRNFIVIGIIDSGREAKIAGAQAFIPLKTAIEMTGRGNIVDIIFIKLKGGVDLNTVKKRIKSIFSNDIAITTSNDYLSTISGFADLTQGFSLAIFLIVLLISLLIIIKTTLASVFERSKDIGILKGIGWLDKDITRVIIIENFIIGLVGGIIGSIGGYIASFIYKANLSSVLPSYLNPYPPCSQYVAKSTIEISMPFPVNIFLLTVFLAVAIKTLTGFLATKRVLRLSPSDAMRQL